MEANGHAKNGTLPRTLKETREQIRLVRSQLQLKQLQRSQKLLENLSLWDDDFASSDLWGRLYDAETGMPQLPRSSPSDRRHGSNWPLWRTETDLDLLRQKSRVLVATNSYAKGCVRNLVNYVISKGFAYKVATKERTGAAEPTDEQAAQLDQLVAKVQDCVDRFLQANHWNGTLDAHGTLTIAGSRERETLRRVVRDGEAFLRFFGQDDGSTAVRFVEPEQVRQPPGGTNTDGWSFGIQNSVDPFDDVEAILQYHLYYTDPTDPNRTNPKQDSIGEFVDAKEVLHLKGPDTDGNLKRGTPEFSWDTLNAFERASKLQRNLSIGAAIRAATAEIWQFAQASSGQVNTLTAGLTDFQRTNPLTGKTESIEQRNAGQVRRIPKGQEYVPIPPDNTPSYVQGVQADLRQGASAINAPEYIVSSDASNADYSSTKEAGAPFVKAGETWQEYYKAAFLRAVWWAVRWAVDCQTLPQEALVLVDIQVEGPAILHEDKLEQAQVDQIYVGLGATDRQTVAMQLGNDWETVQANNLEYQEMTGGQGQPLGLPGDQPPGQGEPPGPRLAAVESVLEAAEDVDLGDPDERADLIAHILAGVFGAEATELFDQADDLTEAWDQMAHPRGEHGRFIKKGGKQAVKTAKAKVDAALKGDRSPASLKALTEHLSLLTVAQLHDVKKTYGLKASGKTKAALAAKVAERLHNTPGQKGKADAKAKPKGKAPPEPEPTARRISARKVKPQATEVPLKRRTEPVPTDPLADRLDRIKHAEQGTGIGYLDRVVNGVSSVAPSFGQHGGFDPDRLRQARTDVIRNGAEAKPESMSFLRAYRHNVLQAVKDLEPDRPDPYVRHVLQGIGDEGHGQLTYPEFIRYVRQGGKLEGREPADPQGWVLLECGTSEAKDASGHEHDAKGQFAAKGKALAGKHEKAKKKLGAAKQAHAKARQKLAKIKAAHKRAKTPAAKAKARVAHAAASKAEAGHAANVKRHEHRVAAAARALERHRGEGRAAKDAEKKKPEKKPAEKKAEPASAEPSAGSLADLARTVLRLHGVHLPASVDWSAKAPEGVRLEEASE